MNSICCVKHVPDTAAQIKIAADSVTIDKTGLKFVVSPYDEYGIEMAIRLKEADGGEVKILSLGDASVLETIRKGIAMGAESGIHLKSEGIPTDPFTTAKAIAEALKDKSFDGLWFGWKSLDSDNAQIGQMVATLLDLPCITFAVDVKKEADKLVVHREIDGGHQVVEVSMPAVFTAQKGDFDPRYPKLMNIMKAKRKPVETIEVTISEPRVKVKQLAPPPPRPAGRIVENATELVKLLKEEAKVL